jgi:hypothetical protein
MALIEGGANYRCSAAGPVGAHIIRRAGIAVIAGCVISLRRVAAYACCAGARHMALIEGAAGFRCSGTDAIGANIVQGACIAVIARCSIGCIRIAAYACCCITGARRMALIEGAAGLRCSSADAIGANVICCAGIVVIARCSIGCTGIAAYACCYITGAGRMALIGGGAGFSCSSAGSIGANVIRGTGIVVVTGQGVIGVSAIAGSGITGIGGAYVSIVTSTYDYRLRACGKHGPV